MLVLTRRYDQTIVIAHPAGDVTVRVVELHSDRVLLGFEAPRSVEILRGELGAR